MNKKAVSNVEIVISFVFFVGFLIFLFFIFNPFKEKGIDEGNLNVAERILKQNLSIEVLSQSVKVSSTGYSCFCIDSNFRNITARDKDKISLKAKSEGDKICVQSNKDFIYLYSSKEIEEKIFDDTCLDIPKNEYQLGLYKTSLVISNRSLMNLHNRMINDYSNVKKELGVDFDLAFNIKNEDNSLIYNYTKNSPQGIRVLARDLRVPIIYSNGELKYIKINLQIW